MLLDGSVWVAAINVNKDTERWNDLVQHLSKWNVEVQRIPALTELPAGFKMVAGRTKYESVLLLSLCKTIEEFLSRSEPYLLVLEDDCRFLDDPEVLVREAIQAVPKPWSMISLGGFCDNLPNFDYSKVVYVQPDFNLWGFHSVLVSRENAERLLCEYKKCSRPSDHVLNEEYRESKLGFVRRPCGTYQHSYVSHRTGRKENTEFYADLDPREILSRFGNPESLVLRRYIRSRISKLQSTIKRSPKFGRRG